MKRTSKFITLFLALILSMAMFAVTAWAAEEEPGSESESSATEAETEGEEAEDVQNDGAPADEGQADAEPQEETGSALAEPADDAEAEEPADESAAEEETQEEPATENEGSEDAEGEEVTVVILHTNDVHAAIKDYAKVSGYRDQLEDDGQNVLLVDAGDHVQGESIGGITKGEAIIEIMNEMGYDVATMGNHEFDYQMEQFLKNVDAAEFPYISSTFRYADGTNVEGIESFKMFEVDGKKIAFVGISTPETYTKSTPKYFQDENGNFVYYFSEGTKDNPEHYYEAIQEGINAARDAGADAVVALGHTGIKSSQIDWNTENIIANTYGFDAYIDGHSHETSQDGSYNGTTFTDSKGNAVTYAQTGTKLANIGELTITFKGDTVEVVSNLVPVTDELPINEEVQAVVDKWLAYKDEYLGMEVGKSEVPLYMNDGDPEEPKRIVRNNETNLGDFIADAVRYVTGADIAIVNSGGIRKNIPEGTLTRDDLVNASPFGNDIIKAEATGQQIVDALEHGVRNLPGENGGFFQVSGMTFEILVHYPSPVITDDQGAFLGIKEGEPRRIANVMINGEPIDLEKTYTVGGSNYILEDHGDGMKMFDNLNILDRSFPNDSMTLVKYIEDEDGLNGVIPATDYAEMYGVGRFIILPIDEHIFDETPIKVEEKDGKIYTTYQCLGYEVEQLENGSYAFKKDENGNYIPCAELYVVVTDAPKEEATEETKEEPKKEEAKPAATKPAAAASSAPKTGDEQNVAMFTFMFIGAGMGAATLRRRRRDKAA